VKAFPFNLLLAFFVAFAGCATKPKVDPNRDWSAFVGSYTYEQALAELGRPYVTGQTSGGNRFAEWTLRESPRMSFGFGIGGGRFGGRTGVGVGAGTTVSPRPSGDYLQLEFGPDGVLQSWARTSY
jgi:hypothetical protein